jgi:uncharacterized lipoprotein YehR (DUF1307 family)
MQILEKKKYLFVVLLSAFLLSACGYKPSSHFIRHMFNETIYVEVEVDRVEPENAPFLKDEMNRLVYHRFNGHIVPKAQASSQIYVSYKGSTFTPLTYEDGYVTRYRANVKVDFTMITLQGKLSKTIISSVESDIPSSSLASATLHTQAIKEGLSKALDEFLAYVSAKSARENSENQ